MTAAKMTPAPAETASSQGQKSKLRVKVLKDRYQSQFMSPRTSRHEIVRSRFVPFNKLNANWDGFTLLPPLPGADLVHAHNRIPLIGERMICSFESTLPRRYGLDDGDVLLHRMLETVASSRCRRIIGMSHHARRKFLNQHRDDPRFEDMRQKLFVRHPNVTLGADHDRMAALDSRKLVVTFVGGHFGRKGGAACVRAAEICLERGIPVEMNIVSGLTCGDAIWTDPSAEGFFEPYLELVKLPNVTHYPQMPNKEVRELLGKSHFCLLPTLADTFGYSMIEAMAEHTPVIGTRLAAVPEVVAPGFNGYLLDIDTDHLGDWKNPGYWERGTAAYEACFRDTNEHLAEQMVSIFQSLVGQTETLKQLRRNARWSAERYFAAGPAAEAWDSLYERVAAEDLGTQAVCDPVMDVSPPELAAPRAARAA